MPYIFKHFTDEAQAEFEKILPALEGLPVSVEIVLTLGNVIPRTCKTVQFRLPHEWLHFRGHGSWSFEVLCRECPNGGHTRPHPGGGIACGNKGHLVVDPHDPTRAYALNFGQYYPDFQEFFEQYFAVNHSKDPLMSTVRGSEYRDLVLELLQVLGHYNAKQEARG